MNVTICGQFRGRPYRASAVINEDRKIVMFAAVYYPRAYGIKRALVIEPERPVSMNTNPLNSGGRKLAGQLQAFLEQSFKDESGTLH